MKKFVYFLSSLLLTCASTYAQSNSLLFNPMAEQHVVVNNRVLAKVNGKAISVVDVMKKMDLLFYRQFPEYTSSAPARYQFYSVNWKHVLTDLIDKEIICADAIEHKMPLTNGDIRQEMETLFGPNIIANLDKIGMSYDEAWDIVKGDIMIRRMLYYRVNTKAQWEVTPQAVRDAYEEYARENIQEEEWLYKVVTIRDKDPKKSQETAELVYKNLQNKTTDVNTLVSYLKENELVTKSTSVSVSEEFRHNQKEMSETYRDVVTKLSPNEFGEPISQKSRSDGAVVYRIFYLAEKTDGGLPPFSTIEQKLKDNLLGAAIDKQTTVYLTKLREHFDVQENHLVELTDQDFQPFLLR